MTIIAAVWCKRAYVSIRTDTRLSVGNFYSLYSIVVMVQWVPASPDGVPSGSCQPLDSTVAECTWHGANRKVNCLSLYIKAEKAAGLSSLYNSRCPSLMNVWKLWKHLRWRMFLHCHLDQSWNLVFIDLFFNLSCSGISGPEEVDWGHEFIDSWDLRGFWALDEFLLLVGLKYFMTVQMLLMREQDKVLHKQTQNGNKQ